MLVHVKGDYFKRNLLFFVLGAIVMSRFSAYILFRVFKINLYIPELLLIPFLPFLRKYFNNSLNIFKRSLSLLIIALTIIILLILIGLYNNNGDVRSVISTARGFLYIFTFGVIGKKLRNLYVDDIYFISLGSLIISFIWLFLMRDRIYGVYYVSLNSIFIVLLIPLLKKKYITESAIIIIVIYIGIFAGLRRIFIVLLTSVLLGLLTNLYNGRNTKRFIPILFIMIIYVLKDYIINGIIYLASGNNYLYERIILKFHALFYGQEAIGDRNRLRMIEDIPIWMKRYIIPHGFAGNIQGNYPDVPLNEFFFTFGSTMTMFVLIIVIIRLTKVLYILKDKPAINYLIPFNIVLYLSYLFYDQGFIIWQYNTVFTGLFIGLLYNKNLNVVAN